MTTFAHGQSSKTECVDELGCECLVVHEEEIDIAGVVDDEGFVAGGHQVAGFLV